ncbi:hypothetical protein DDE74_04275 [Streptomyces lydicus]|uniref:NAD-dependent epimerase/dehydratase domain-containing protein n=2 Tax=Streptomyces lydicus TaxID=47763 RepID=A0A3Q9KG55_9ACTN|nr:hypothetical protein DDE74_04275 [Streptomyces lydicus]
MKLLVIGGSGFLGTELVRQATAAGGETAATYHSRPGSIPGASWYQLDLRAPGHIDEVLATVAPNAVINVTSGESDWAVTADGSIRVAMAAARHGYGDSSGRKGRGRPGTASGARPTTCAGSRLRPAGRLRGR